MIIKSAELETVCGVTSVLPRNDCPEIAFAGKSNVGKSSLINTLLGRRKLARTSSSPGKTQTINFYKINQAFYLVDLPGYGYAKASEQAKAQWGKMIENYLSSSLALKAVFLLIDIRHDPGENDIQMYHWISDNGFVPILIATKADKLSRSAVGRQLERIRQVLGAGPDIRLVSFSSVSGQGREEILQLMAEMTGIGDPASQEETVDGFCTPQKETGNGDAAPQKLSAGDDAPEPDAAPKRKARWPKEERHKAARKKRKGRNGI